MDEFQCYTSNCIQTRGALPAEERSSAKFCPHIVKAREALSRKQFAPTATVNVQELMKKVNDEKLEKSFLNSSSDGEVTIFKLPNDSYAVPLLDEYSSPNGEDFVHVRGVVCALDSCSRKTKTKKHAKVEKIVPTCPHSMLGKKRLNFSLFEIIIL